jgi:N-acetylmuramoyl-L-alanine amidase
MQVVTLATVLVLGLVGCAPGPRPGLKRLYGGLKEPLEGLDLSGLKGRKIVIDPGHGGVFRGARGSHGTDEADVNLGVALHLAKLLEEAGAQVVLTRSADTDFVGGDSLRLGDDLKARVELAGRAGPDMFMSLHHNADPGGDDSANEIQVYYRLADDGPSLDIARVLAAHLITNLGEERNQVIAGNYYVLRNALWPAVLCEPSFITNPRIEAELRLGEKQELEAAAYFLGIVDYFTRGVPEVARLGIAGTQQASTEDARPLIEVVFDGTTLVDGSTVALELDGVGLAPTRVAYDRFVAWPDAPLAGGKHALRARARAYTGNASREAVAEFEIVTKPAAVTLTAQPAVAAAPYPQKLTALVLDANGRAVADSTPVNFTWSGGARTCVTLSGKASLLVGRDLPFGVGQVTAGCAGLTAATPQLASEPAASYVSGLVMDSDGRALSEVTVTLAPPAQGDPAAGPGAAISDQDGFFVLGSSPKPSGLEASAPGFRRAHVELDGEHCPEIRLERFYRALPRDITVALDPQGGGDGGQASNLNLAVAGRLKALLESVGIRASLTRGGDRAASKVERVAAAESAHATLLLSIAHQAGRRKGATLGRYPASSAGARLAGTLGEELKSSFGWDVPISDNAEYVIQQTSCPAAEVTFLAPRSRKDDALVASPYQVWTRAYALLCGILKYLGVGSDPGGTFAVSGKVTRGGKPAPGAVVTLDGTLEAITDASGGFGLRLIEPGPHTVTAFGEAARSRALPVDETSRSVEIKLD